MMNEDEYVALRLDDQIGWYDSKSQSNQRWHKRLRILELLLAASIPFLAGFAGDETLYLKIAIGAAGVLIAVIAGVLSIYKFQELWIEYRTTCESLRHHKYRFLTGAEPYAGPNRFMDLVENVEGLISRENTQWAEYTKSESKEKGGGGSSA